MMARHSIAIALGVAAGLLAYGFVGQGDGFKRERSGSSGKLKDALEGKPPPPLAGSQWLNWEGKPPTWQSLKGKVVLIEFWAHW